MQDNKSVQSINWIYVERAGGGRLKTIQTLGKGKTKN